MNTEKSYVWKFDLEEYTLTKEVREDYLARVNTLRSVSLGDIARAIAAERTEYREETIAHIAGLISEKIQHFVCEGCTVATGATLLVPAITGTFTGEGGAFDPSRNRCTVNAVPSQELRRRMAGVAPVFSGHVRRQGGARIALVTDTPTGRTDGTLTAGGIVEVRGRKIRCLNADGTGPGRVCFVRADTGEEAAVVSSLAVNTHGRLIFNLPDLEEGHYFLRIETHYSSPDTRLKSMRFIEYPLPLTVGRATEEKDSPADDSGGGVGGI